MYSNNQGAGMNNKVEYKGITLKAICHNNRLGLEVGITIGKVYPLITRTNRYITIKNDYGVVCKYWRNYFILD